jgi:hypothetical protein
MKKLFAFLVVLLASTSFSFGQAISTNGGAIQGTITDGSGAAIPGASVAILDKGTGNEKDITTDRAGFYSVGPLTPGGYKVTIKADGFEVLSVETVIRTGTATPGSFKMTIGKSSETIEVNAGAVQVNTDQIALSDVITKEQIDSLPVNGRNFLDLAQIEPGVILQSGESFDPTKAGYSAVSTGGVSGRTTRILLDGQDITDETVGTTIFNVSQGAIGEFQLNRSTQDVSGEVTSQGAILVSTNSGTNAFHGQLFGNFQDNRALFSLVKGINIPFQRNQFGGSVGGPILKDKLFFFGNSERIKQATSSPTSVTSTANGGLFGTIAAAHPTTPFPFTDTYSTIRLDYNGPFHGHYFVRGNYEVNSDASNFGDGYWLYANRDNTPGIVGGADYQFGRFTHSFRYGYEKFHNLIADKTAGNSSIYNGLPGLAFYYSAQGLFSGPNDNAPQGTFQSDKQFRYDGGFTKGTHNIRFGYAMNRIQGGGFAAFFGLGPRDSISASKLFTGTVTAANPGGLGCGGVAGAASCPSDPLNGYFSGSLILGNGQGFFTEKPGFGLIGGGTADWRESAYIADTWKVTSSLVITAGLRWSVDTGRANQDLATPTCNDIDTTSVNPACAGNTPLFAQWNPSFTGTHVHQPYANFGPQLGLNFSPGNHKTSYRASAGIFFENDVFNNTTNARTDIIKSGAFFNDAALCSSNGAYSFHDAAGNTVTTTPDGTSIATACNTEPLSKSGPQFIALQAAYQATQKAHPTSPNPSFVGETLQIAGAYAPTYRTPYSEQFSGGISHEIFKGSVLSVDYVHNATLKIAQANDQNHVGAARFLNTTAALAAIGRTTAKYAGCAGTNAGAINCAITKGATIDSFAAQGLDSGNQFQGGLPISYYDGDLTETPNANGAAFAGANPLLGNGGFLLPQGKAGYDALQIVYRSQQSHPIPGVVSSNLQVSYTLSRVVITNTGGASGTSDAFFSGNSSDNDHPTEFMGRSNLDHSNELSFGGSGALKYGPKFGLIGHVYSAPPATLSLDTGDPTGDIFRTDLTGDGTTGDFAPGTNPGDYGHRIRSKDLPSYINNFNATKAGTLTPAGQALINAGLFSQAQLIAAKAVVQPIANPSQNSFFQFPRFATFDASFSYPIPVGHFIGRESLTLEPGIVFYNALNIANYNASIASGVLLDTTTVGGTTNNLTGYLTGNNSGTLNAGRTVRGSGTFDQGAPRTTEFQLKLNF